MERAQTKKVGSKLREIIGRRIAQNRLSVPGMPAVALKCLEQLRNQDAKFNQLAATIEQDPLIASRLLRIVNSPAYGVREPITSVERAVGRLGLKPLKMILIESPREVFMSKSARIREAFRGIWEHCLAVGTLARDVAAALPRRGGAGGEPAGGEPADADSAYLAGLFHDVGKPVVAALLLEAERNLMDELGEPFMTDTLWLKVVNDAHRDVGAALAGHWNLAPVVAQAIAGFDAYDEAAGPASCANLVRFANALAKREGLYVGDVDIGEIAGIVMEGRRVLGLDEAVEDRLTAGLAERIQAITAGSGGGGSGSGSGSPRTVNLAPKG